MTRRGADTTTTTRRSRVATAGITTEMLVWVFTIFLVVVGLVATLSASTVYSLQTYHNAYYLFEKQIVFVLVGLVGMGFTTSVHPDTWHRYSRALMAVTVVLLVLVLVPGIGIKVYGGRQWLGYGPVRLQPSEIAKLAVLLAGASILARKDDLLADPMQFYVPFVFPLFAGVAALVLFEPDLGTTISLGAIVLTMLFVAGARWRHLAGLTALGVTGVLGVAAFSPVRLARLTSFLHPSTDPAGKGYQVLQSLIAVGSGRIVGLGLGASRQKWNFLPNAHNDFIFAVISEEGGMIGSLIVLLLLCGLVVACLRAALRAPDRFTKLLAAGVGGWIGAQALMNLGAVTGLLPITGIPLPLVSAGGSNVVVLLCALGIVVRVAWIGDSALRRADGRRRRAIRLEPRFV